MRLDHKALEDALFPTERGGGDEGVLEMDAAYETLRSSGAIYEPERTGPLVLKAEKLNERPDEWMFEFGHLPTSYTRLRSVAARVGLRLDEAFGAFYRHLVGRAIRVSGAAVRELDAAVVSLAFHCTARRRAGPQNRFYILKYLMDALTLWGVLGGDCCVTRCIEAVPSRRCFTRVVVVECDPQDEEAGDRALVRASELARQQA